MKTTDPGSQGPRKQARWLGSSLVRSRLVQAAVPNGHGRWGLPGRQPAGTSPPCPGGCGGRGCPLLVCNRLEPGHCTHITVPGWAEVRHVSGAVAMRSHRLVTTVLAMVVLVPWLPGDAWRWWP